MDISTIAVKQLAIELGADLVGIAAADSFEDAPQGFRPGDVLPGCASVIVLASKFPGDALYSGPDVYTAVRNQMVEKMDKMAVALSEEMQAMGISAHPVKSIRSKSSEGRLRGPISLKHAAVLAGLGKIGKNTLLINNKRGNMLWLSAVLTSAPLTPDDIADYEVCSSSCSLCVNICPSNALGEALMEQQKCYKHAFKRNSGQLQIECWECRKVCPSCFGTNDSKDVSL